MTPQPPMFHRYWRSVRSGHVYVRRSYAVDVRTREVLAVYQSASNGLTSVRPMEEFLDGRFEPVNFWQAFRVGPFWLGFVYGLRLGPLVRLMSKGVRHGQ